MAQNGPDKHQEILKNLERNVSWALPGLRHQWIGQDIEAPGGGGEESHGSQSRTSLVNL